ncbi:MAG TPA: hypothetical protein VF276_14535, partial [Chloroflexia bacterium]
GHWHVLNARVGAWLARRQYPHADIALLTGGFSYSEGDKYAGDLFPRWTTGTATVALPDIAAYPLTLTMRLADHRPPTLPRADLALSLAGQPVPADRQPVPTSPVESVLTATIARPTVPAWDLMNLALISPTWNPKQAGAGARNEDLGLLVESLRLQRADGRPLRLVEALPVQPMYPAPRWYYDTQSPHLVDVWVWYLNAAHLPRRATVVLAGLVVLFGGATLAWGAWRWRRTMSGAALPRQPTDQEIT